MGWRRKSSGGGPPTLTPIETLMRALGSGVIGMWDGTPSADFNTFEFSTVVPYGFLATCIDQGPNALDGTYTLEGVRMGSINGRPCPRLSDLAVLGPSDIAIPNFPTQGHLLRTHVNYGALCSLPGALEQYDVFCGRNAAGTEMVRNSMNGAILEPVETFRIADGTAAPATSHGGNVAVPALSTARDRLTIWGHSGADPEAGYTCRVNGVDRAVVITPTNIGTTVVSVPDTRVGSRAGAGYFGWLFGFTLALSRAPTASDIAAIEAYAAAQWGFAP